jgi:hypothetical protein
MVTVLAVEKAARIRFQVVPSPATVVCGRWLPDPMTIGIFVDIAAGLATWCALPRSAMPRLIRDVERAVCSADTMQGNEAMADLVRGIPPEDHGDVSVISEAIPGGDLTLIPPSSGADSRNLLVDPGLAFSFARHGHDIVLVPLD